MLNIVAFITAITYAERQFNESERDIHIRKHRQFRRRDL